MSKLSNRQTSRLAGLLNIAQGKTPYTPIAEDLKARGLAYEEAGKFILTPDGQNERDRLQILAGLMVEDDYVRRRKQEFACGNRRTPNREAHSQQSTHQDQQVDHTKDMASDLKKS